MGYLAIRGAFKYRHTDCFSPDREGWRTGWNRKIPYFPLNEFSNRVASSPANSLWETKRRLKMPETRFRKGSPVSQLCRKRILGQMLSPRLNKTENPTRDALDKTKNFANCKFVTRPTRQNRPTRHQTDQGDQTNQTDQQDWPDNTRGAVQELSTMQNCQSPDQTDQGDQTDQTNQTDQTIRKGWCKNFQTWKIANLQFRSACESVTYDHQCNRCWRIWKWFLRHNWNESRRCNFTW